MQKAQETHYSTQVIKCGFDTNQIQITGTLKTGQSMQASHLDIWSSRNLAWEAGLVERIVAEGDEVYSQGASTALNDKKIALDSDTLINNIKINRTRLKRDNTIRVGYKFFTNQKMAALLLVRGSVPVINPDYTITDLVEVQLYKDSDLSNPSLVIKGSELTEYVSYPKNNSVSYRRYKKGAADNSREAGFGIYLPLFSEDENGNKNKHVVYSYLIFPEPKEGYNKVVLVDKTGLAFLDVAELMVFPENPLSYAGENSIVDNFLLTLNTAQTSAEMRAILSNRNFSLSKPFNSGLDQGKIFLKKTAPITTVVLWEANALPASDSGVYQNEVNVLYGPFIGLTASGYYEPIWGGTNLATHLKDKLKTPFRDLFSKKYGNPLPYTPKGIDSPRTFAYKMYEQWYVRDWYKKSRATDPLNWMRYMEYRFTDQRTTLAVDKQNRDDYFNCYLNEIDVNKRGQNHTLGLDRTNFTYTNYLPTPVKDEDKVLKPFLPGNLATNATGYNARYDSPCSPDKAAGVDSVGILSGAIGMGESDPFDRIANIYNYSIGKAINRYYSFITSALEHPQVDNKGNPLSITGIDSNGFPVYYTNPDNSNSFLNTQEFRFTKADIERATVLVPDIGQIQRGDILVKYEEAGDIHLGIVVGFTWETKPPIGSAAFTYMDKVLVLSCRKGFRQVTLGTWGNPPNMFGGFTMTPKLYQLRRLLTFTGSDITAAGATANWEWVREANLKLRDYYPPRDQVPADGRVWANSVTQYVNMVQSNDARYRYYRYLPKTSLSYKTKVSIFGTPIPSPSQTPVPQPTCNPDMRITCLTGMRDLNQDGSVFRYHSGVDVISSYNLSPASAEKAAVLVAPEDGLFYVFQSYIYTQALNEPRNKISIPDGFGGEEKLSLRSYSEETYGLIGVLITNPVYPKAGRVYLFHHMGPTTTTETKCILSYRIEYIPHYPGSLDTAILVKAGDFIGYMGNRGISSNSHVHLEVYEYFKESLDAETTKGWELVNPLSCFHESLYTYNENGILHEDYNWWIDIWKSTTNYVADINNHGMNLINKPKIYLNDSIDNLVYADIRYYDNLLSGYALNLLKNRILIKEE